MTQHAGLTLESWKRFDRGRQVLMIANEMHRSSRLREPEAIARGYERVLRLADLTAQAGHRPAFLRELLRWRDGVAELYLAARAAADGPSGGQPGSGGGGSSGESDRFPERHLALLRCLLLLHPEAARQRPYVLP